MTSPAVTLLDRIHEHAARRPSAEACVFFSDNGDDERVVTYAGLAAEIRGVASALRARLRPGERCLLMVPEGPQFVPAFLGCLEAGVIAVPAYPPLPLRSRQRTRTLRAIAADCRPAAVITSVAEKPAEAIRGAIPELADVWWTSAADLPATTPDPAAAHASGPDDIAFLQYTSGSTSLPKGVVVTHRALVHNLEMMRVAFGHDENLRMASWLPLFHDMGLIGNVLAPLWAGGATLVIAPLAFIKRPARWLRLISGHRATVSGAPNFAYDLCVDRIRDEEIEGVDLSGLRTAYNGAEPVRSSTLRAFAERFAPYGFEPRAWWPCYGLAEATLLVTGADVAAAPKELTVDAEALQAGKVMPADAGPTLVSSGHTWLDRTVLIVDSDTGRPVEPGQVGEIWVGGPSLPAGYWENPEASEKTFRARPSGGPAEPFMRTGDLGFVHEGELYVTGRLKDVVIVGGRNHYPQDLEETAENAHPSVRKGCVAAFTIEDHDTERVVLVVGAGQDVAGAAAGEEAVRKRAEIARAVRTAVTAEHGIPVHDVVVVGRSGVPKTSSGKLQRSVSRAAYLNGEYAYPDNTE